MRVEPRVVVFSATTHVGVFTDVAGLPLSPRTFTTVLRRFPAVNTGTCTDLQAGTVSLAGGERTANVVFKNPAVDDRYCTGHYLITVNDASGQVASGPVTLS